MQVKIILLNYIYRKFRLFFNVFYAAFGANLLAVVSRWLAGNRLLDLIDCLTRNTTLQVHCWGVRLIFYNNYVV